MDGYVRVLCGFECGEGVRKKNGGEENGGFIVIVEGSVLAI